MAYGLKARYTMRLQPVGSRGGSEEEVLEYVDKSYKGRDEQAGGSR